MDIEKNIEAVKEKIAVAAAASGRSAGDITLVAAAKTASAQSVKRAVAAGVNAVGENRAQELLDKDYARAYEGAALHFIGQLQKNKVRLVVGLVDLIESVDSSELMRLISERALMLGLCQDILLEVNIAGEASKAGFSPAHLETALFEASDLLGIRVRGLMAIPPIAANPGENRQYFAQMRQLFVDIGSKKYDNVSMDFLSMGMSGDYEDAIAEGANMVRVGSAIFGAREYTR